MKNQGFSLVEIVIVLVVIAVLASIAYPSYQQHVIKTKRTAMMAQMHHIASNIENQKLIKGSYQHIDVTTMIGDYPKQQPLYHVTITPLPLSEDWKITAQPKIDTMMENDGDLTLNAQGLKCRLTNHQKMCGKEAEFNH